MTNDKKKEIRADIFYIIPILLFICLGIAALCFAFNIGVKYQIRTQSILSTGDIPVPKHCYLCGSGEGIAYHAPCILNLSTGQVTSLRVYELKDGDYNQVEKTEKGYIAMHSSKDLDLTYTVAGDTLIGGIDKIGPHMDYARYCAPCRALIQGAIHEGAPSALVDLHNLADIKVYPVEPSNLVIRDYAITIATDGQRYDLTVVGNQ